MAQKDANLRSFGRISLRGHCPTHIADDLCNPRLLVQLIERCDSIFCALNGVDSVVLRVLRESFEFHSQLGEASQLLLVPL